MKTNPECIATFYYITGYKKACMNRINVFCIKYSALSSKICSNVYNMNVATLSCVVVWCDVLFCCGVMYVVWGTNVVVVLWYGVLWCRPICRVFLCVVL